MRRVLITSGPTREPIDSVRFLSNASSGRMGSALARHALERGHEVVVVSGPAEVPLPPGVEVVRVETALEMLAACRRLLQQAEIVIGAAAVADFRPRARFEGKLDRRGGPAAIELEPNPDILAELGNDKGDRTHVGFALEAGDEDAALERARAKLQQKRLDWIVVNRTPSIGADTESFWLVPREGGAISLGRQSKDAVARAIFERIDPP